MKFSHINIKAEMPELEKEKKFLCEVLDFKDGFRPHFHQKGFWIYSGDEAVIHLLEGEADASNTGYIDHLAFHSSGVEALVAKLRRWNIEYHSSYVPETKALQIFCKSPLGIKFEIIFTNETLSA